MSVFVNSRVSVALFAFAAVFVAVAPTTVSAQSCTYAVEPPARSFGSAGGGGSFFVRAPLGCVWHATPTQPWITIASGGAGNGNGIVAYSVSPGFASRAGRIEVATTAHVISQAAFTSLPSKAGVYLNNVFDQFQSTLYVYRDADSAANHFAARGRFPEAVNDSIMPPMDEVSKDSACMQFECITAVFNGSGNDYGGWYFLNGILAGNDRTPRANWGNVPNAGVDLSGATELVFWARGDKGGEVLEFFAFGVGRNPVTGTPVMPYPDSSPKQWTGFVSLTNNWQRYRIPLVGDMTYVLGGFGWGTSAVLNGGRGIKFYLDEISFNKARPNDMRFLLSYETIRSDNPFDAVNRNAAYLYDNSLALVYFATMGDAARSKILADTILHAISHDRFYADNRIRNAYQAGDLVLPPGWNPNGKPGTVRMPGWFDPRDRLWYEDQTHVSTSTGNVAWCMLGLLSYYGRFGGSEYLDAAKRLGGWVDTAVRETRPGLVGFTGGFDGWEPAPLKRLYKSTEHNLDLMAAFRRLNRYTNDARWLEAADFAKQFVLKMWDPVEGKFWTGTAEDGVTIFKDVVPTDVQAWAIQVFGSEAGPFLRALEWVEQNSKVNGGYGFKQNGNNRPCRFTNGVNDKIWYEGTAQMALAWLLAGNRAKYAEILPVIRAGQQTSGGVYAASEDCADTGFNLNDGQPWFYFRRLHVGATAWLALAERGVNPFWF